MGGKIGVSGRNRYLSILALLLVTLFALYLRGWFLVSVPQPTELKGDAQNYRVMAIQLVERRVYGYMSEEPNAYVTPGYPLFLAVIRAIARDDISMLSAVRWVQAILSGLTALLIGLCACKASGRAAGVIAALLYAIYPPFVWSVGAILTEVLFNFAFAAFVLTYLYAASYPDQPGSEPATNPSMRVEPDEAVPRASRAEPLGNSGGCTPFANVLPRCRFFSVGAVLAIAVLVRPMVAPLLILLFVTEYLIDRKRAKNHLKSRLTALLWCILGFAVVMLPWWTRNVISLGKLVLFATQTGNPLLGGTDPYLLHPELFAGIPPDRQLEAAIYRIIEGFRTEPVLYLKWFTIGKLSYIFGEPYFGGTSTGGFLKDLAVIHQALIAIGTCGMAIGWSINRSIARVTAMILGIVLIQLAFIPQYRYAYPVMALLCITSGWFMTWFGMRLLQPIRRILAHLLKSVSW